MCVVYVLRSTSTGRFYIGSTTDLEQRLRDHNAGNTASTRGRGPWTVAYQESLRDRAAARTRERDIKRWKSRVMVEQLIGGEGAAQ